MQQTNILVNGRFLNRKVTGVERVAHELLRSLNTHFLDSEGCVRAQTLIDLGWNLALGEVPKIKFTLLCPPKDAQSSALAAGAAARHFENIPQKVIGKRSGHAWEQWDLAKHAGKDWLLNLCNTAPLFKRRQMVFIHDAQVFAIPGNFDWKFRLWYKFMFKCLARFAHRILTNSQFSSKELQKYLSIKAQKLGVILLGVDHVDRIKPSMPAAMAQRLPKRPFVLAVSSVNPNKNFNAIVKAIENLRKQLGDQAPPCVFVGQRNETVFQNLQHLPVGDVIELGYVSDAELIALYQHALCLVYPSFYEGFGLPPLEAMHCGTPVVASATSSIPEVCGQMAMYCDPNDATTIAQQILAIQNMNEQTRLVHAQLSKAHSKDFSWQEAARQLLHHVLAVTQAQKMLKGN